MNLIPDKLLLKGKWWMQSLWAVHGCSSVYIEKGTPSECKLCWSASFSHANESYSRLHAGLTTKGQDGVIRFNGHVRPNEAALEAPLNNKKPTVYAVWNDLFHPKMVADHPDFIHDFFLMMHYCLLRERGHIFVILTKRPHLIPKVPALVYSDNIYVGTTAGTQKAWDTRVKQLCDNWPGNKVVSVEPMLERIIPTSYRYIDGVFIGQESKGPWPGRPCDPAWTQPFIDTFDNVFIKQLASIGGKLMKAPFIANKEGERWRRYLDLPWQKASDDITYPPPMHINRDSNEPLTAQDVYAFDALGRAAIKKMEAAK